MQLGARAAAEAHRLEREERTDEARAVRQEADGLYLQALAAYDEAIRLEEGRGVGEANRAVLGVTYANRGILKDRMGDYRGALADYERSMALEPEVAEGPGFLTRFMRNQPGRPPAVDDRAGYLREQLALPESERVLRRPEEDARQRAYKL
jgi:tetratricopeptide (TPR) repeat protein